MLIELLVSMAVASILVVSGSALMIYMFKKNSEQFKIARMYSDLLPAFDVVTRRISMAGTWAKAHEGKPYNYLIGGVPNPSIEVANPFTVASWDLRVVPGQPCLLFSFDRNRDGTASENERMGYRLRGGVLEEGTRATSCLHGDWAALTTRRIVNITQLQFVISSSEVETGFIRRSVHINLRGDPSSVAGPVILLKRTVRVRNDRVK